MPNPILIGCLSCAAAGMHRTIVATRAAGSTNFRNRIMVVLPEGTIFVAGFLAQPGCAHQCPPDALNAFDHDGLDLARATATKGGGLVVFRRFETRDALFERWKFDHDETM